MYLIMADEVEEFQVVQPVILAIAVFVMDFCLIIHGEEELAVRTSSTLMFQEFSSGCVQSDVRAFSCAPVAPVAIIWACFHTERDVTCDGRLIVPFQGVGFPHHPVVLALTIWLEVFLQYPGGTFLVVLPFCPSPHLVPEEVVPPVKGFLTDLRSDVIAPSNDLWVERSYDFISRCSLHPFYGCCEGSIVPFDSLFAGFYDGRIPLA